jgi:hypothetical protein
MLCYYLRSPGKKTMARAQAGARNYKCCATTFDHQAKNFLDPHSSNAHAVPAKRTATCVDAPYRHTPASNGAISAA